MVCSLILLSAVIVMRSFNFCFHDCCFRFGNTDWFVELILQAQPQSETPQKTGPSRLTSPLSQSSQQRTGVIISPVQQQQLQQRSDSSLIPPVHVRSPVSLPIVAPAVLSKSTDVTIKEVEKQQFKQPQEELVNSAPQANEVRVPARRGGPPPPKIFMESAESQAHIPVTVPTEDTPHISTGPVAPASTGGVARRGGPPPPPPPPSFLSEQPKLITPRNTRRVHWTLVPTARVAGSIWQSIAKQPKLLNDKQTKALTDLFMNTAPKKTVNKPQQPSTAVSLLETRRANIIGITVSRFHTGLDTLANSVAMMDNDFSLEDVQILLGALPTTEEAKLLSAYRGTITRLAPAEQFLSYMLQVPFAEARLQTMAFMSGFDSTVLGIRDDMKLISEACSEIYASTALRLLLQVHSNLYFVPSLLF